MNIIIINMDLNYKLYANKTFPFVHSIHGVLHKISLEYKGLQKNLHTAEL